MTRPADPVSTRAVSWACVGIAVGLALVVGAALATAYLMDWLRG